MFTRREIAPFDPITGVACAIAPRESVPQESSNDVSFHHTNHSEAYLLGLGLIGRALRTSRIQLSHNDDHNKGPGGYHSYFERSKVPRSMTGRCRLIVCYAAGAVPAEVIDMRAQEVRPITQDERQRFFTSNELRMQSEFAVRRFFTAFVLNKVNNHARNADISKYKGMRHLEDKMRLGNDIIGKLIPEALAPLNERYEEARRQGTLPTGAPPNPAELVRQFIFQEPDRFSMLDDVVFNEGANLWLPAIRQAA